MVAVADTERDDRSSLGFPLFADAVGAVRVMLRIRLDIHRARLHGKGIGQGIGMGAGCGRVNLWLRGELQPERGLGGAKLHVLLERLSTRIHISNELSFIQRRGRGAAAARDEKGDSRATMASRDVRQDNDAVAVRVWEAKAEKLGLECGGVLFAAGE